MNRRSTSRLVALTAAAGLAVAALSGCATGSGGTEETGGDVTLTWWHNGTGEPLKSFWEEVASEFEADHPGVTVEVEAFQNEDLQRTLIPNALQAGGDAAPDLFMVWAEGEIKSQVEAGYLKDLSGLTDVVESVGGAGTGWNVDGKQYGIPYRFGIEGIWYNADQFEQAGVTRDPGHVRRVRRSDRQARRFGRLADRRRRGRRLAGRPLVVPVRHQDLLGRLAEGGG
ncbi:hypothetical protein GCM10009749_05170 [Agromyces neolithicus]|uniref:Extracellular solute-binding protein n=1 Tax=Agromyces neolithicus TaxID=269420 RepID=A0ABN2LV70_9MICO